MKYFIIILTLFSTLSCENKANKKISSEVTENTQIEVYDFDQLESVLSSNTDKTLVVNFWATWCKPCIEELPFFEAIQKSHKKNIKVILVSLDFPDKLEDQLIPFIKKKELKSQVILLDDPYENVWIPKIDSTWSGSIPATLIINKSKRIFYEKSFTMAELEKEVLKFIKT